MTPENPQDPQKGKADEAKVPEEAKDSKVEAAAKSAEQPEPKPKRTRKKAPSAAEGGRGDERSEAGAAEDTAAAETGVDKDAAEAEKPKRTPSAAEGGRGDERSEAGKAEEPPREEPKAEEPPEEEPEPEPAKAARRESSRRTNGRPAEPAVLVRAQARYVRTSARKARLVCDHIRGKDVAEARSILAFTPRAAAKPWLKLLESAIANAEHNHELVGEELRVFAVHADEGPTLKRYRPRAMGRATRIRKRTSHLTITLTPKES